MNSSPVMRLPVCFVHIVQSLRIDGIHVSRQFYRTFMFIYMSQGFLKGKEKCAKGKDKIAHVFMHAYEKARIKFQLKSKMLI